MRRGILIAAAALGLLVVAAITAVLMLPADRIGQMVAARAATALDRDVSVERFRVKLLPRLAIALDDVVIGGPRAASAASAGAAPPFAAVTRVELRPRLLPLLQRRVVIDEVVFDGPELRVQVDADGASNLPAVEEGADAGDARDAQLRVRRLRISRGAITYEDARDSTTISIAGIEQSLRFSGDILGGELSRATLDGTLDIADIDATLPGRLAWPLRDVSIGVRHNVRLDRAADRLDIAQLQLRLQAVTTDITGSVAALGDAGARTVDLRASTGQFDVARLVESLPRGMLEGGSGDVIEGAAGRARLDATIAGRAGAGEVPGVAGSLVLEDVALDRGRHGRIADGVSGAITFSLDSVSTDGINGRLLGEPLFVAAAVRDFADPQGTVQLRTALAMAQAEKLGLLPAGSQGSGRIAVDVRANGAFARPAGLRLDGHVDLAGIAFNTPALKQSAIVDEGRIVLNGRGAAARGLRARIGTSDASLDFTAEEYLPYALGDSTHTPLITFDARSTRFDVDEIFGVERSEYTYGQLFFARLGNTTIDGRSATDIARETGLGLPDVPPIRMDGRIRARSLVNGGVVFDDVDVTVAASGGALDVRAASFRMLGGGVQLTGRLGLAAARTGENGHEGVDRRAQPLALDYTVNGVGSQQFLQRFTTFRDHIGGDLLLRGAVRMHLDEYLLPVVESVAGSGTVAIVDGELVNWPLLRALGERIGLARFDTLSFRDWTGRYTLAGSRVVLEESMLEGRELSVRAAGSFDLAGGLDIGATLYVPAQWARGIPGAPAAFLVGIVSAADGRVPVGARITGTTQAPSIRLDLSEAGARTASAAREAAQQQARDVVTRVVDDVSDRLPPRDSIAAVADTLRNRVESNIADRLRRVLRPGAGSTPPPAADTAAPRDTTR